MFDIKIGTIISSRQAVKALPELNSYGFETYELQVYLDQNEKDLTELAAKVKDVIEDRAVSALAFYENPLMNDAHYEHLKMIIKNAHKFGCNTLGIFAGGNNGSSVDELLPLFKERYTPIAKLAEDNGVKIGFENCSMGGNWWRANNIAFAPRAWEMLFDAVNSPNIGLEWEPAHQMHMLIDPLENLRKFAKKVVHLHGKDVTLAWDVIREYGVQSSVRYSWDRTPGFGDTNWSNVFTILLQNGFEGACDIEGYHDPVHYDDMEWTAQITSLQYLKRCRGGIDFVYGPEEIRGYQGRRKK